MNLKVRKLQPGEIIPLSFDFMFTTIFNKEENIDILESFLSCYLEIPLSEISGHLKLIQRQLPIENKTEARKQIDLLLDYKGKKINIELSNKATRGVIDRNVEYICGVHSKQLKSGFKNYHEIEESIQININNYRCNENGKIKDEYYLRNSEGKILTNKLRIDLVDIVNGLEMWYPNTENKLSRWCKIFVCKSLEELKELLGDDLMKEDSKERLLDEINKLSSDEEYLEMYEIHTDLSREELERNTIIEDLKIEAKEQGMKEGMKEGIEQGIEQGIIQVAKNMLEQNISIDIISKTTGLTEKEILNLKSNS